MPNVRVLDFQKVKLKEKVAAKQFFESEQGKQVLEDIANNQFKSLQEEDYSKALEKTLKDEDNKKKLYVKLTLFIMYRPLLRILRP